MDNCIIFCAGSFDKLLRPMQKTDFIIAADGGFQHTQSLGLSPNVVLGDFDSLGYVPEGAERFPAEKDDTDTMLAIRCGLSHGHRRFFIYGSLDGPRLDHTIANFQALQFLADHQAQGFLIGTEFIATVIKNASISFPTENSGILSVFCLGGEAQGVYLSGLKYPMQNGTFHAGFPLGVSNHFTGAAATISVADGSLLVLWERKNGLPLGF